MKLTPREKDVISLIADGYGDKEIACQLKLSPRTVQTHLNSVILKLNARNRCNAVSMFIKLKYSRKK